MSTLVMIQGRAPIEDRRSPIEVNIAVNSAKMNRAQALLEDAGGASIFVNPKFIISIERR